MVRKIKDRSGVTRLRTCIVKTGGGGPQTSPVPLHEPDGWQACKKEPEER